MLRKGALCNEAGYRVIELVGLRQDPLGQHLILIGALCQQAVERAQVPHPSNLLQGFLHLVEVTPAARGDR